MSASVIVYSTSWCAWCTRATALLRARGIAFEEVDAEAAWGPRFRDELEARTGGRTVPQVVVRGRPIGGYEALAALDLSGELGALARG
jgi:glutaredoxin 3